MTDWHPIVGALGGIITFASIIPYAKDILYGTTRPNIVSYILWGMLLAISMFAQSSSGASWSIILIWADLLVVVAVIAFCIFGYGYKKYGRLEFFCFSLAIIAIISWQVTEEPVWAIIFALVADILAGVPTIVKTYRDPRSEIPTAWFMTAIGGVLGILSTTIIDLPNLLFPIWIVLINSAVGILALRGRK